MLFKEYCILPYVLTSHANQGIVTNKKSSYCKDRANQGRVNQGLTVGGEVQSNKPAFGLHFRLGS